MRRRAEESTTRPRPAPGPDSRRLAREVVGRFQEQARSAGVALTLEAAPPTTGYWDRLKVEQVLVNLLPNALKYGGGQPVCVRVHADEEKAVLEVEDCGPGIPEADQVPVVVMSSVPPSVKREDYGGRRSCASRSAWRH